MQVNWSIFSESSPSQPKSLSDLKPADVLKSIYNYGQGGSHRDTIESLVQRDTEVEILQQNHDYTVLRIFPTFRMNRPSNWLCGFADRGLFIHNMPYGDIDYSGEPFWYILSYLNRREEGFHRIQGDLLIRKLAPWEIEDVQRLDKEDEYYLQGTWERGRVEIGNSHEIDSIVTQVASNQDNTDQKAITKSKRSRPTRIRHDEHREATRSSSKDEFREVRMQRRGEEQTFGDGD